MKNDPEFLKALKDPKMQGMFAQMLKDPASMADFQGDADFCRLISLTPTCVASSSQFVLANCSVQVRMLAPAKVDPKP